MDSRKYERMSVAQAVRLVIEGRIFLTTEVVDMSKGGVGIKSSGKRLNSGQVVDVDFYKSGHPRSISYCKRAMVVHVGPETTGLMFAEYEYLPSETMRH